MRRLEREPSPSVHPHRRVPVHHRELDPPDHPELAGTVTTRALAAMTAACSASESAARTSTTSPGCNSGEGCDRRVSGARSHAAAEPPHAPTSWPAASSSGFRQRALPASCQPGHPGRSPLPQGHLPRRRGRPPRSDVERTVPPASWVLALTTVIMAGPSGAAAEIPVSTAAMAATTASFLRCHDAARARPASGRRRGRATDGIAEWHGEALAGGWSRLEAKDARLDGPRHPQG